MGFNWSKVDYTYEHNMSHSLDVKGTEESQVVPDSTTNDRLVFYEGEDVLLHDKDGLLYFGTITKVCLSEERCLIHFEDEHEKWASFRSLHKVKAQEDVHISCIICKTTHSSQGNLILPCHYCRRGYHQNCHTPILPHQFANEQTEWMCSRCVKKEHKKEKEKELKHHRTQISLGLSNNNHKKRNRHSTLKYDLSSLHWNGEHTVNEEEVYCYCGKNGEWFKQMLQCYTCRQWFHDSCVSVIKAPILAGDRFFLFMCSVCNQGGDEKIFRLSEELTLSDMAHIALYNLTLDTTKRYQDLDKDVVPFLEEHLNYFNPSGEIAALSVMERRNKLLGIFWQNKNRFMCGREFKKKKTMWGLRNRLPPPFPSTLSSKTKATLKEWNCIVLETNALTPTVEKPFSRELKRKKGSTDSVTEGNDKKEEEIAKKRLRTSDPDFQRTLRVRQQRVASEESVCDESSDDKPLVPCITSKSNNKRKRVSEETTSNAAFLAFATSAETSCDEMQAIGTLDLFIPAPRNFEGANNPFFSLNNDQNHTGNSAYFFVRPIKKRLSEKDIRITKNGEVKRKRFIRKWKRCAQLDLASSLFRSESFTVANPQSNSHNNPKESVMNYFGAAERLAKGDKYAVYARRILPNGQSQFLIQWESDVVVT